MNRNSTHKCGARSLLPQLPFPIFYVACAKHVIPGSKLCPVLNFTELHAYSPAARSCVLLIIIINMS